MAVKERLETDLIDDEGDDEDTQEGKYLVFSIGKEQYGLEIRYVIEIIGIQTITEVPDMPHFVKGVINLRGKVIPVMDMNLRFGMPERAHDDRTCIVVINAKDKFVGLIVDRVAEVANIPAEDVSSPPEVRKGEASRFIQGIGKIGEEVRILLDVDKLLFDV